MLLWCHETQQQPFETGIQRVVRRLTHGLGENGTVVVPVGWDRHTRRMMRLDARATMSRRAPFKAADAECEAPWLLVPELSTALADEDLDPLQLGRAYGLKTAAVVHDLIPLKLSEAYDSHYLKRFRRYIRMIASADVVITTTRYVANDLRTELNRLGLAGSHIVTISLPAQFAGRQRSTVASPIRVAGAPLKLLTVSSWEPRKNLPRLLRAIRQAELRSASKIDLHVIGSKGHFAQYDAELEKMLTDMPNVFVHGSICDDDLAALYADCHASVYSSIEEGFGLPIAESLWLATPCVCHSGSSMAEVAPGGGTLMIDMANESAITNTLLELVAYPDRLVQLSLEIAVRSLPSWRDYAAEITASLSHVKTGRATFSS